MAPVAVVGTRVRSAREDVEAFLREGRPKTNGSALLLKAGVVEVV